MQEFLRKNTNIFLFAVGLLAVLFMGLPYLILGQDAIVTYHDQLDGELIAYLLQAKHLGKGGTLPEFLNGACKTALIPPAPGCVLLFLCGDGYAGLVLMQLLGSLCGYVGMYLCVKEAALYIGVQSRVRNWVIPMAAMVTGIMYAYLPFLPVYGLAQYGLPMLLCCFFWAKQGKRYKTVLVYSGIYALCSSLVLVGFGVLGALLLYVLLNCKKKKERNRLLGMWFLMLVIYIVENWSLLQQTLGLGSVGKILSHKSEYVLESYGFWNGFLQGLTRGGQHSGDYHYIFIPFLVLIIVVGVWCKVDKQFLLFMGKLFAWNVFFALIAALWDSALGVMVRSNWKSLGAFQLNRLLWMAPCLWYLMLGCGMLLTAALWHRTESKWHLAGGVLGILLLGTLVASGGKILLESNLKPNIQKLRNPAYAAFSFKDYYAVGVMDQIDTFIQETTGQQQEAYRVVSLGIDPAAALYHGFYCLDGYSNNYALDYKHEFRQVIEPELLKSEYLRNGFDTWGNRCYLFSAECPGYYTIEKNGFFFQDYDVNVEKLKEMGASYLLSAAYIQNAQETGLVLLREEPFETQDSYYRIFLYGFQ